MAAKNFYDAVLVGLDLQTLLAGALLSKRGFRVLLIGHGQPWPSYEVLGVRFPRAPFALMGHESPALSRVFSELALKPLIQRRTRPMSPSFQVVLPGHRVDFGRDERAFARELEREFPLARRFVDELWQVARESGARIDDLLERDLMWPPERFFERREFARASAQTPLATRSDDLSSLGIARFDGAQPVPTLRGEIDGARPLVNILESCIRAVDTSAHGPDFSPRALRVLSSLVAAAELEEGGLSGLYELLIECIRTHNGSLRVAERVDGLTLKRGAVHSVHLFPSDEEIGCNHLLWGLPVARLGALLGDRSQLSGLFEETGEPRPVYARFTLNLLLRAEALPEGMARRVLLLADEPLWVQTERTPDGERAVLTAEAQIPVPD